MKRRILVVLVLAAILMLFGLPMALDAGKPARDADAVALAAASEQARTRALRVTSNPILRQVDVDARTGNEFFRFTDAAATMEIDVTQVNAPNAEWQTETTTFSKLTGYQAPAMNMAIVNSGPARVFRAIAEYWQGCTPTFATLYLNRDALEWVTACRLADGRIAMGSVDASSGAFQPSPAPPAFPPPTALPP